MGPSGDHQVDHQPQSGREPERDAFPGAAALPNRLIGRRLQGRIERPDQERAMDADGFETTADDPLLEGLNVVSM